MRGLLMLGVVLGAFAGVFFYRRAAVPSQPPVSRPPLSGAVGDVGKAAELPGNPVTIRLGRAALEVEGDAADPIEDVKLWRVGPPEQKIEFTGGSQSQIHVLWNFDLDPNATYRAEVKTRYRVVKRELRSEVQTPVSNEPASQ